MDAVAFLPRCGRVHGDAVTLLRRVHRQRLRRLLIRPVPLDLDKHFVLVPRLQLNRTVERAKAQVGLPIDDEALLFAGDDTFAAHIDAARGNAHGQQ